MCLGMAMNALGLMIFGTWHNNTVLVCCRAAVLEYLPMDIKADYESGRPAITYTSKDALWDMG